MEKQQHTPGPWMIETVPTSVGICHKIGPFPPRCPDDVTPRSACLYADYPSVHNPADNELYANARLIATAPDLLEAHEPEREGADFLDWIADRVVHIYGESENIDFVICLRRRAAKARAAIAKATGG